MEKLEILKIFLKNGLQVNKRGLEYLFTKNLNQDNLLKLINQLKNENKSIIDQEDIEKTEPFTEIQPILLKTHTPLPETISIEDVIQDKLKTYEAVRGFLGNRWELVNTLSINKINKNIKSLSLIAEITKLDKAGKTATLQDNTGIITASIKNLEDNQISQMNEGDVLSFVCENGSILDIKKIVNPDISLFKTKTLSRKNEAIFLFYSLSKTITESIENTILKETSKYDKVYIFDLEDKVKTNNKILKQIPENTTLTIISTKAGNNAIQKIGLLSIDDITLLICHKDIFTTTDNPANLMINLLKKRTINYQKIDDTPILPFIIDPVPDIFVTNLGGDIKTNYKNTILLSIDKVSKGNIFWLIDLGTYECLKISLK